MTKNRIIIYFFMFLTAFFLSFPVFAVGTGDDKVKYAAFGDSIAAGYALSEPSDGYVNLIAEEYGLNSKNFAVPGMTSEGFIEHMDNLPPEDLGFISEAKLITVSIGSNDILQPFIRLMTDFGSEFSPADLEGIDFEAFYTDPESYMEIAAEFINTEIKEKLLPYIEGFKENLSIIINRLKDINPDAKIIFTDFYNPFKAVDVPEMNLNMNEISEELILKLNEVLYEDDGGKYVTAGVRALFEKAYEEGVSPVNVSMMQSSLSFDPHPNSYGHSLIKEAVSVLITPESLIDAPVNKAETDDEKTDEETGIEIINAIQENDFRKNSAETGVTSAEIFAGILFAGTGTVIIIKRIKKNKEIMVINMESKLNINAEPNEEGLYSNFIHDIIDKDLKEGRIDKIHTRFPPEPNAFIHIGSAKAILINHQIAIKYGGLFNLRFDDTNPAKEDESFVRAIIDDIEWLIGEKPNGGIFYGSDYFETCYLYAVKLIKDGKAYICDLNAEEMKEYRGTLTEPGKNSPFRDRSVDENLMLFEKMKDGDFPDGFCTLRAKIDMASPNMNMRDPAIYRILKVPHHRHGNKWNIYPLYDYAHPIQDTIEGITHSCCSIEFENHRPLYDWVVDNIGIEENKKPHQYEFSKLNITYTLLGKRYLTQLINKGLVDGWDDPRMPTLRALRRRGFSPSAIKDFVNRAGVGKAYGIVDVALLEHCMREELGQTAPRKIAVADPVKLTIINYPEDKIEFFDLPNNPSDPGAGTRALPFSRNLFIERSDFEENPPPKFFRLKPGGEVRLMGSYIIKYEDAKKDVDGNIIEILCTADLETRNNNPADGRKIKGTIHWLSAEEALDGKLMEYGRLFTIENVFDIPEDKDYDDYLNKDSVREFSGAKLEPSLKDVKEGEKFQFVRMGYYCLDTKELGTFNSIVPLKSSYKA